MVLRTSPTEFYRSRLATTFLTKRLTRFSSPAISFSCRMTELGRSALWLEIALPADVVGPVVLVQGCQRWIAAACRARRSCVQP